MSTAGQAPPVRTVVHLVRHGEVDNPERILYGRLPGYVLSELGERMAQAVADDLRHRDVTVVTASPLERAQITATPIAEAFGVELGSDEDLIEAGNSFEGGRFTPRRLLDPRIWHRLRDVRVPSWGEPYTEIVARMEDAVARAREAARGHEAVLVSHQLPIWTMVRHLQGERLWHDPRRRRCTLASVSSITYLDDEPARLDYSEPAAHLLEQAAPGVGT